MQQPLAERLRPQTLEEVYGQEHLLSEGKVLRRIIESGKIPNMIFFGPSGTGKTTVANLAAKSSERRLYYLNATTASVSDIKEIIRESDSLLAPNGCILYLDEIQNFNKKQQQSLLEFIENGRITLVASTTENPYFYIYNAILSRSTVFEFKPLGHDAIFKVLKRCVKILSETHPERPFIIDDKDLEFLSQVCGGDARKSINAFELAYDTVLPDGDGISRISSELLEECARRRSLQYDKAGDNHYDLLSAFQKSIRGSDPNAAVHYLARLLESGDLQSVCRRLLVIAAEDVGLAYPQAISIANSCVEAAFRLGLPEARIPLAEAVLLLACSPKSNSAITAIDEATSDLHNRDIGEIPAYLRDAHYSGAEKLDRGIGYQYPHSFPGNYVKQQYLPDAIRDANYYRPGTNKFENNLNAYLEDLKKR